MSSEADNSQLMYERLVFNRKLVVFAHALLAFLSALVFLANVNLSGFPYSRSRSGLYLVLALAPPIVPYLISGVYSWRVATFSRIRVLLFLLVLVLGSVLMGLEFMDAFGTGVDRSTLLLMLVVQCGAYLWAAEWILHVV